jgi:PAS domain S-box-containing protein
MVDMLNHYFHTTGFTPHGHCFLWTPLLLWSYVVFDSVIAASYYSIPVALWYFVRKRPDLPFRWIFVLFGLFVMACGTTHVLSIWNIWEPDYWLDAGIKGVTAVASVITAVLLWPLIPRALAIPSQAELARVNAELQREIAERKRSEERLQLAFERVGASEARLEAFLNNSSSVMFIKDIDGRYVHVNEPFVRSFGLPRERVISRTDAEIFPAEQALRFTTNDAAALRSDKAIQVEEIAHYADGMHTSLVCKFPIHDANGQVTALGGIVTDITQRKQIENKITQLNEDLLRRTTELESANQELEAFCYSVSHDLRAPVRAIDGFRGLLADELGAELSVKAERYLGRISSAARRMGELIDALLSLSQISREPLHTAPVDLSALATEIARELEHTEPQRRVAWHIQAGLNVEGDARLLRIALQNLLGNAWKFTKNSAAARIEFGTAPGNRTFFVRDNGIGFHMAYKAKLFRPFERLHGVNEYPGNGIGLATVHRIFQRHRGRVWAEGVEGSGATFFFEVAAKQAA